MSILKELEEKLIYHFGSKDSKFIRDCVKSADFQIISKLKYNKQFINKEYQKSNDLGQSYKRGYKTACEDISSVI